MQDGLQVFFSFEYYIFINICLCDGILCLASLEKVFSKKKVIMGRATRLRALRFKKKSVMRKVSK